jgi:peptidoglycan/LPS O-acetylase OafA/YrhL
VFTLLLALALAVPSMMFIEKPIMNLSRWNLDIRLFLWVYK